MRRFEKPNILNIHSPTNYSPLNDETRLFKMLIFCSSIFIDFI